MIILNKILNRSLQVNQLEILIFNLRGSFFLGGKSNRCFLHILKELFKTFNLKSFGKWALLSKYFFCDEIQNVGVFGPKFGLPHFSEK